MLPFIFVRPYLVSEISAIYFCFGVYFLVVWVGEWHSHSSSCLISNYKVLQCVACSSGI